MLVSAIHQRESTIYIHVCPLPLEPPSNHPHPTPLRKGTELSLCCAPASRKLSVLHMGCIGVSLTVPVHLTLLFLGEGFCRVAGVSEVCRVGSIGIKTVWGVGIYGLTRIVKSQLNSLELK